MKVVPLGVKQANDFVVNHHRHNGRVITHKFSIGLEVNGELIGVGVAGIPLSRHLDDGKTLELRRVCVKDGHPNACSKLIARMRQIGQLMGYEKVITYTLQKESGASLRAVRGRIVAKCKPAQWIRKGQPLNHYPAYDEHKYRWELQPEDKEAA